MDNLAFAGSFDPLTNGHLWVIQEARKIADSVTVFIASNPHKTSLFSVKEREKIILQAAMDNNTTNIKTRIISREYVSQAASSDNIEYLIRGIRSSSEYDYENLLQQTNYELLRGAKTLFVMPPRDLGSVSSSYVKSLIGPIGWHYQIKQFLPNSSYKALIQKKLEQHLCLFLGEQPSTTLIDNITKNYERPYHNLEHIIHCLTELNFIDGLDENERKIVGLAIIFHDIIQESTSSEDKSANFAVTTLKNQLNSKEQHLLSELISSTAHSKQTSGENIELKKLIQAIDLSIFGQDINIYTEYSNNIRKEYSQFPDEVYYPKRKEILQHFLNLAENNKLYGNDELHRIYNHASTKNLQREINSITQLSF